MKQWTFSANSCERLFFCCCFSFFHKFRPLLAFSSPIPLLTFYMFSHGKTKWEKRKHKKARSILATTQLWIVSVGSFFPHLASVKLCFFSSTVQFAWNVYFILNANNAPFNVDFIRPRNENSFSFSLLDLVLFSRFARFFSLCAYF